MSTRVDIVLETDFTRDRGTQTLNKFLWQKGHGPGTTPYLNLGSYLFKSKVSQPE